MTAHTPVCSPEGPHLCGTAAALQAFVLAKGSWVSHVSATVPPPLLQSPPYFCLLLSFPPRTATGTRLISETQLVQTMMVFYDVL